MVRVGPPRSRAYGLDLLEESTHMQGEETEHHEQKHGHHRELGWVYPERV